MGAFLRRYWTFLLGLILVVGYWWLVRPIGLGEPGAGRGYVEDFCSDMSRQVVADNLLQHGRPLFKTTRFMAPTGMPVPFFSWSIERDWVGAYVWMWSRDFPFLWAYFGLSIIGTFLGVGWLLGNIGEKAGFSRKLGWVLATGFVLFHVPRHFKIWHHYEYLSQHWAFWSIFLDAWIWQRLIREKRWSWSLECWRGLFLLGVLGAPGYFWGPMYLEWVVLRVCMVWVWRSMSREGARIHIEGRIREALIPVVLGLFLLVIDLRWFPPLIHEMKKLGDVHQGLAWFAHFGYVIRPLWLDSLSALSRWFQNLPIESPVFNNPETVVSIGWLYWIPVILGIRVLKKRYGGPGLRVVLPFLVMMGIAILYATWTKPFLLQKAIQLLIPFMAFFRVASRWGQFMPHIAAVLIILAWPELSTWARNRWVQSRFKFGVAIFVALSVLEVAWLFRPVNGLPPLEASAANLLEKVHDSPGTTVLDLPFCVAGGNGVCTTAQCPHYPKGTVGQCFSAWHEKKVYGLYQARLVSAQCEIYNRSPYVSWFNAWAQQRCFTDREWEEFCKYLSDHTELSAVLVYPDIWHGAGQPECRARFDAYLGPPLDQGQFVSRTTSDGRGADPLRILRYAPRCR